MAYLAFHNYSRYPRGGPPPPPPPPPTQTPWVIEPALIGLPPTDIFQSEEIRGKHNCIWQHYLSTKDIQKYRIASGATSGSCFNYEALASHAVTLENSKLAQKLLDICAIGLSHKEEDLAQKITGAKNDTLRQDFNLQRASAQIGLLNGKCRELWQRGPGTLKLVKINAGIIRFDGSSTYVKNEKTGERSYQVDERDLVKGDIEFKEVKKSKSKNRGTPSTSSSDESDSETEAESESGPESGPDSESDSDSDDNTGKKRTVGKKEKKLKEKKLKEKKLKGKKLKGKKGEETEGEETEGEETEGDTIGLSDDMKKKIALEFFQSIEYNLGNLGGTKK
jgi:hypothetical protein